MTDKLKAEAYDILVQIEQIQANMLAPRQKRLQDINQQINAEAFEAAQAAKAAETTPAEVAA